MKPALLAALCLGLSGCVAEATTDSRPVVVDSATGFLVVDWSISGYFADAVLLDPAGYERTTPVDLGYFEIFGEDELVVPIDFPSNSFF
jgi:hypothetical protein